MAYETILLKGRAAGAPADLTSHPKLLGLAVDDSMNSHKSYELAQALASYSAKMTTVEKELRKLQQEDKLFQGHNSEDVAHAFQEYAKAHHGQGLPADFLKMAETSTNLVSASKLTTLASASALPVLLSPDVYSWSALLMQLQWARIIYCFVWVISGLLLLFFGYASFFWLNKTNRGGYSESPSTLKSQKRHQKEKGRPFLSGGVGGLVMGFLFFSYLASVINNTLCADSGKKTLSAGAFFAVWLVPGLIGAVLGGYFFFLAKVMTAVLGGTSFTLILTAMFGIKAILIRAILLAVIVTVFTAPLLAPRINAIQKLVLNACTSLVGIVTLLNGIALFAPPYKASSNWIDLWTMLFCSNASASRAFITAGWGSGAFKGYIAGSVLGSVVGFTFELFLHRQSGHDADSEWNEYLGTYTSRVDLGSSTFNGSNSKSGLDIATSMGAAARAGLFEPAPNAWKRMVDYFDADSIKSPAQYGNLSRHGTLSESITDRARRKRTTKSSKGGKDGPARFQALSKRDDFDDEESEFSCGEEEDDEKNVNDQYDSDEEDKMETKDLLASPSSKMKRSMSPPQLDYKHSGDLQRPPLLATSSSSYNASRLSGSTFNNSSHESELLSDSNSSPYLKAQKDSSPSAAAVTATPSLINAITRIQAAQEAARNWQRERDDLAS